MQSSIADSAAESAETRPSWLDRPLLSVITLNWETVLFATILIFAIVTPRNLQRGLTSRPT